jgi:hypothetical protein
MRRYTAEPESVRTKNNKLSQYGLLYRTFLRIFLSDSHLMEYVLSIQQVHRHSSSATALRSSDPTVYAHPALIRYKYAYHDSDRL